MNTQANNPIRSLVKSICILQVLEENEACRIVEIADQLDMTSGSVHHHLSTLKQYQLVVKEDGKYRLGMRFLEIGENVRSQLRIYHVGGKMIDNLAEETGEIANLMIEENGEGVYVYIAAAEDAVLLDTKIGTRQYLHTSAAGKAILAELSPERIDEIIQTHGLPSETEHTVTSREQLMAELDRIRERGIAFDTQERAKMISCIGKSITNNDDELLGSVSVSAPASKLEDEEYERYIIDQLKNTASVIGINVSYK